MVLHIISLKPMVLQTGMIVIPPHARCSIGVNASIIWITVVVWVVENLCHECPRVVQNDIDL